MAKAVKEEKPLTQKYVADIIKDADKGYREPKTPEEIAFQKGSVEGHDPNKLDNPHPNIMTIADAEQIVKNYGEFTGNEVPNELARARKVLEGLK